MHIRHKGRLRHLNRVNARCKRRKQELPYRIVDIACHEAAHALFMRLAKHDIGKMTIKRKGDTLGYVTFAGKLPAQFTRQEFTDWLRIFVAGAVAEKWNAHLSGNCDANITLRGTDLQIIYRCANRFLSHDATMKFIQEQINSAGAILVNPKCWNEIMQPLVFEIVAKKKMNAAEIDAFFKSKDL